MLCPGFRDSLMKSIWSSMAQLNIMVQGGHEYKLQTICLRLAWAPRRRAEGNEGLLKLF